MATRHVYVRPDLHRDPTDPLAIRGRGGVLIPGSSIRSITDANSHAAEGGRGIAGAPAGAANPATYADAHWGGGTVGSLAADTTEVNSSDSRRRPPADATPAMTTAPARS